MRVLGIDTATSIASVGIVAGGTLVHERSLAIAGNHARTLLPLIQALLDAAKLGLADLGLIAVSIGPGSFTGLRIGLSVAKGLSLATGVPVIGVNTLVAYARTVGPRPHAVWPVLDARKGEVYAAGFRAGATTVEMLHAPMAIEPARLAERLPSPCTLVGNGVDAYRNYWRDRLGADVELIGLEQRPPSGAVVAIVGQEQFAQTGADDVAQLEPSYCRQSEAELRHDRRIAQAALQ